MNKLGKYRIDSELGRGGMGVVYHAHDPVIGRDVAIKVLHEHAVASEGAIERFRREARSAGRLSHDNIMTLYDFDESKGRPYLVMELLDGTDLRSLMRGGGLSLKRQLEILIQIASGLEYAHDNRVVHRDVKPGNIQVLESGRVKILDFGIARIDSDAGTMTHSSLGTPRYMSPEQIRGEAVDRRSDIFSFGALAYELLTGSPPFPGDSVTTVMYNVIHEDPEPIRLQPPHVEAELRRIVTGCLAKSIDARFPDLSDVIGWLQALVDDPQIGAATRDEGDATTRVLGARAGLRPGKRDAGETIPSLERPANPVLEREVRERARPGGSVEPIERGASPGRGTSPTAADSNQLDSNQPDPNQADPNQPRSSQASPATSRAPQSRGALFLWLAVGVAVIAGAVFLWNRRSGGPPPEVATETESHERSVSVSADDVAEVRSLAEEARTSWGASEAPGYREADGFMAEAEEALRNGDATGARLAYGQAAARFAEGAMAQARDRVATEQLSPCAENMLQTAERLEGEGSDSWTKNEFVQARESFSQAESAYRRTEELQAAESRIATLREEAARIESSVRHRMDEGWTLKGRASSELERGRAALAEAERLAGDCQVVEASNEIETARDLLGRAQSSMSQPRRGVESPVADASPKGGTPTVAEARPEGDGDSGTEARLGGSRATRDASQSGGTAEAAEEVPPQPEVPPRTETTSDPPAGDSSSGTASVLTPGQRVDAEFRTIGPALCEAMKTGSWSRLPRPVRERYEAFGQALTEDHVIRDASVKQAVVQESSGSVEQRVSLTVVQQQKGRDDRMDPITIPMVWIWTVEGEETIVAEVRNVP